MSNFETYQSPYTWRYGSAEMRRLWSEVYKRRLWRQIWVALAEVQHEFGLLEKEQVADLRAHMDEVDVKRALEIETRIHHDLMAELKVFAEQCPRGGGALHMGATSMDIEDNAEILRVRSALNLIIESLEALLQVLTTHVNRWATMPLIAFTHLQPAEPSTLGYRLAQYAQDLYLDWQSLNRQRRNLRGKGFKGAVGSGAAYAELIGVENLSTFEARLAEKLDLPFFPVTTQTYPRKQDYFVISALSGLGGSLYKFAFDLRILQSPPIGELSEPFGEHQVGSSAMPFKRNPIRAEKIDSLARALAQMPRLAWDNAAHSLLERTLDDSANRRSLLPEAFLIVDELLRVSTQLIRDLQVSQTAIERNLKLYGPFAATERILMAMSKGGADRQQAHEILRRHAMTAWETIMQGHPNPLFELLGADVEIRRYLTAPELRELMDAGSYVGNAPTRAKELAAQIQKELAKEKSK